MPICGAPVTTRRKRSDSPHWGVGGGEEERAALLYRTAEAGGIIKLAPAPHFEQLNCRKRQCACGSAALRYTPSKVLNFTYSTTLRVT